MEGMKADTKTLLPLVDLHIQTSGVTLKDAVAHVAAQHGVTKSALTGAYYRNTPSLEYHRNRLLLDQEELKMVWAL